MKRTWTTIYAIFCTLAMAGGFLLVFLLALAQGVPETVRSIIGLVAGFVFAPIYHELGHVGFASMAEMDWVYVKLFCLKFYTTGGERRIGFASP